MSARSNGQPLWRIRPIIDNCIREDLAMLRRGKAAGIDKDALDLMARALYDAVGACIGKMERTLDAAGCDLDPAQVDRSELDAFLEEVK